jgi:hypothetical protein
MKPRLKQGLAAAVALLIAAPFGALQAIDLADPAGYGNSNEPKDCKMKPEDPRCKDQKLKI